MKYFLRLAFCLPLFVQQVCAQKWTASQPDSSDIVIVSNIGGQKLGYAKTSGVKILTVDGFAFKDLNTNNNLDKYEDWRLPVDVRV